MYVWSTCTSTCTSTTFMNGISFITWTVCTRVHVHRNNFFCFAFFKTLFFSFFYFFLNCVAWSVTQARYYRYCRRLPLPRELQFFQTNIFRNSFFNKRYLKKLNDGQIPFWRSPQHQLFVQPFSYPWHIWLSWQQWFYRQPCVWHRLCVVVLRQQQ